MSTNQSIKKPNVSTLGAVKPDLLPVTQVTSCVQYAKIDSYTRRSGILPDRFTRGDRFPNLSLYIAPQVGYP